MSKIITFLKLPYLIYQRLSCSLYFPSFGIDRVLYILFIFYYCFKGGSAVSQDVYYFGWLTHIVDKVIFLTLKLLNVVLIQIQNFSFTPTLKESVQILNQKGVSVSFSNQNRSLKIN